MWTPKIIREVMYRVKAAAQDMRLNPMIIVPYLNEERLRELERENVSGVDLCGNGVVIVPDKIVHLSYRQSQPISQFGPDQEHLPQEHFYGGPGVPRPTKIQSSLRNSG